MPESRALAPKNHTGKKTMIKMIGKVAGVPMLVADDKVDKFLSAGYRLAEEEPTEKPAEAPKPKRTRKTITKK